MKIVIINGQSHKGSTYNVARSLATKISDDIKEFFLPRDFDDFCKGCCTCFFKSEMNCSHYGKLKDITDAIDEADVIILASPVYVFNVTGAMKSFLDHYGYRFMVHRPDEGMFHKQAVCISTAGGGGTGSTNKTMAHSTLFWGCARTYKIGVNVREVSWDRVDLKIKEKIEKKTNKIANKILKNGVNVKTGLKTKILFSVLRLMHKKGLNETDKIYWQNKGWLGKVRPWK